MATIIAYIVLFHIVPTKEGRLLNIMDTNQALLKLVFDGTIRHAFSTILTKADLRRDSAPVSDGILSPRTSLADSGVETLLKQQRTKMERPPNYG
jgi:hypothetical protein